jgi:hypothetical protein
VSDRPAWFVQWVRKHASVFGLNDAKELKTLLSWLELFLAAGYSRDDLDAATTWMASRLDLLAGDKTRFLGKMGQHLALIQGFIRQQRSVAYRDAEERNRDGELGTCVRCSGAGALVVPHLQGVRKGEWVPISTATGHPYFYTMAILCPCPLGRWRGENVADPERRPMTLAAYEAHNPRWMVQMERRREELNRQAALAAPHGDERLTALLKRLAENWNVRREDDS